ncbi:hypothetical protein Hanom_Chr09g00801051 [Helianthus anomalus]
MESRIENPNIINTISTTFVHFSKLKWIVHRISGADRRRRSLRRASIMREIDHCNIMDARSSFFFPICMLSCIILLSMTCYLSWCFCHYKVTRNTSPISLSMNLKTHQESPTKISNL